MIMCQVCESLNTHLDSDGRCDYCNANNIHNCISCKRAVYGKYLFCTFIKPNNSELEPEPEAHTLAQTEIPAFICLTCIEYEEEREEEREEEWNRIFNRDECDEYDENDEYDEYDEQVSEFHRVYPRIDAEDEDDYDWERDWINHFEEMWERKQRELEEMSDSEDSYN